MELTEYTARLRDDLAAAAALGGEDTQRIAHALAGAVERSAQLMLVSALSDFAREASEELGDRALHVQFDGTQATVEATRRRPTGDSTTGPGEYRTIEDVTGDISRVTLRLVDQIKARAEEAATEDGMSLNSWVSQAVQGALRDQMRKNRPDDA
ncbi:toxin-antitoxin system HicB family antitoxin [Rhodococcus sp. ABRD24]|uniref:toxin-antitoxin system HicB family antitoxin n=1 Tax=Rhodococcus sp. ABRD24 TaxID=2507582 RepID=UPI00103EE05B|nr:toxin-antitoxin system HicB family antitoxin [Rhodococcus sp. ABRD24]QBJ98171.1 toxin-antitoxin system HicB family antitoxin [Rhodococcus sp. ABRD24]